MKNIEVDPDFQPPTLPVTEKAAEEVPEDLVIHYDFNDGARNLTKFDHNPELINAQLTEEDLPPTFGQAVQFGQEESRIQIGNTDGMPLVIDDFTVALWLRVKGNRADGYGILGSISDGKNLSLTGIGLRTLVQGNPEFLFYHRDAKYRYQGKTKLNDGKWHHLAVTKTGYLAQIYVNGQPEGKLGTIFTRTGSGTTSLSIGTFLDTGMANGAVDNFRLYKRKLSAEEILAIYEYERYIPVGL